MKTGFALILLLVGIVIFYFNQEKIVFFPEVLSPNFKFNFPVDFKESNMKLSSGQNVNYLVFNSESTKGQILYFHGNAGSLKDWGFVSSEIVKNTGWSVWIMDYPGFGKSPGPLPKNEKLLIEMGRSFWDEMAKEKPHLPIVLFGRSIGSGMASALAVEKRPAAMILESPYLSIAKLGHEIYPFLPESFSRFDLNNEKWVKLADSTPILILHGTDDSVIPFRHGEHLSQLNSQAQLVAIQGGDHNNLEDYPLYWTAILNFLSALKK